MRRHRRRSGGDAKRPHHQGQQRSAYRRSGTGTQCAAGVITAAPAAEPGTDPQLVRNARGQSRKIARRLTAEAFKALAAVMQDQEAAATARVNAANTILEWGHGRRGDSTKPVKVVDRVVKVDWGRE